ncbi:hypothetical protein [Paenibacillus taichungensis]
MQKFCNDIIDNLASNYAKIGSQLIFNQLYVEVTPLIKSMAMRARTRAINLGVNIPMEDFESQINESLYDASKNYKSEYGHFIPRFHWFVKRQEPIVWRMYETKGCVKDRNGKKYEKAKFDYLECEINFEKVDSAEKVFLEEEEKRTILREFSEKNKNNYKIIVFLQYGLTNKELAVVLNEKDYNAKIRKLVQRAKESFRDFLSLRK